MGLTSCILQAMLNLIKYICRLHRKKREETKVGVPRPTPHSSIRPLTPLQLLRYNWDWGHARTKFSSWRNKFNKQQNVQKIYINILVFFFFFAWFNCTLNLLVSVAVDVVWACHLCSINWKQRKYMIYI